MLQWHKLLKKKSKLNKRVFELQLIIKSKEKQKKKLMENLFKNTILNKKQTNKKVKEE